VKLLRGLRRTTVFALSLVGAYTVIGFAIHKTSSSTVPAPDGLQSFLSPDGSYRAELLTWAGGGGLSPYCSQALLVVPASADVKQAGLISPYEVYSGQCDSFADHSFSPKIVWGPGNVLHVSFSINSTFASAASVKLKKTDATGAVKIEFSAQG
jgi:hypothetical protein